MAVLIAPGTTETAFSAGEFTVASGSEKILFITNDTDNAPAPGGVEFEIAYKVGASDYQVIMTLTAANIKQNARWPAGTYGTRRLASTVAAGINVEG